MTDARFAKLGFMDQNVTKVVQLVVYQTLAICKLNTVYVSLILLEEDVTNVKPENMEICATNNVLQGVKLTCVKEIPVVAHTDVL
jgi:hypothetical protein